MQGMPGKQGSHQCAAPKRASHPPQQPEDQDGVGNMQDETGEVMACRLQPVKLKVQRVRQPGERMPVSCISGRKRPHQGPPAKTFLDPLIVGDIQWIVEVDEIVLQHPSIKQGGHRCQQETDSPSQSFGLSGFLHQFGSR